MLLLLVIECRQLLVECVVWPEVGIATIKCVVAIGFQERANGDMHELHFLLFGKRLVPHAKFIDTHQKQESRHVHSWAEVFFEVFLKFLKAEFDVVIHIAKIRIERRFQAQKKGPLSKAPPFHQSTSYFFTNCLLLLPVAVATWIVQIPALRSSTLISCVRPLPTNAATTLPVRSTMRICCIASVA